MHGALLRLSDYKIIAIRSKHKKRTSNSKVNKRSWKIDDSSRRSFVRAMIKKVMIF